MTREAKIWEDCRNGKIPQDTAGQLAQGTDMIYKAVRNEYIDAEYAEELLSIPTFDEYMKAQEIA